MNKKGFLHGLLMVACCLIPMLVLVVFLPQIKRILGFGWSFNSIRTLETVIQELSAAYLPLKEEGVLAAVSYRIKNAASGLNWSWLFLLLCPLMHIFMLKGMHRDGESCHGKGKTEEKKESKA